MMDLFMPGSRNSINNFKIRNKNTKNFIFVTALISLYSIFTTQKISAEELDAIKEFNSEVIKSLPMLSESITIRRSNNLHIIEFCPDNTCEVIKSPDTNKLKDIKDFTYLYIYYASGLTLLATSTNDNAPFFISGNKIATQILKNHAETCSQNTELELASCVLNNMARNNNITISFFRYDEGKQNVSRQNIESELSLKTLKNNRAWLESHCKKYNQ
jgi:hypothetical protein